jgi:hypothetical protein
MAEIAKYTPRAENPYSLINAFNPRFCGGGGGGTVDWNRVKNDDLIPVRGNCLIGDIPKDILPIPVNRNIWLVRLVG